MVSATNVMEIDLDKIRVSRLNTRKDLDAGSEDANGNDLANSILERGLINPVTVVASADGNYELIAGQRRLMAFRQLGKPTIPAIVREGLTDNDATVLSLVENVQRADMNAMDKANAYQSILSEVGQVKAVAKETGVTVPTIRQYLSLLKLAPTIQERLSTSDGPSGIQTLSRVAENYSEEDQERVFETIGGFNQRIQGEMLKRAGGDLDLLDHLREQALEGAFEVRSCHEGLCFDLPDEWKSKLRSMLQNREFPDMALTANALRFPGAP